MTEKQINRFKIAAYLTLGIVVFLIWVGGFVRSTGAGMGCPDWPRCFGMWVPPTCECQISAEYLTAHHLNGEKFNVYKTWTEYVNRLIGALTGLFIIGMFIMSLPYRKTKPLITWLSGLGVLLVGFEGWLGKKVVDSNLHEGMITIHMVVAMILLMVMIAAYLVAFPPENQEKIFDRFYRINNPNSRRNNGTGLGLPIIKLAAESHKGSVKIESEIGKGSTFTITLPLN